MDRPTGEAAQEAAAEQLEVNPFLARYDTDTSAVPFRMADGVHIPGERYYDQGFADLENQRMWSRSWQWAARVEDVPYPGDFIEYTIVDESVMVVRVDEDTIKVFHNVCPHRATRLAQDCGTFPGGQIVCPFHGWRWNLTGEQSMLYGRKGFIPETVQPERLALREVRHAIRYGFVWVTLDEQAPEIEEFFGPMDRHLEPIRMDLMRMRWWKYAVLPANWKVALEAFMEAYHIMQAHPELAMGATGESYDADVTNYMVLDNGHVNSVSGRSDGTYAAPIEGMGFGEWFLRQNRVLFEGTDATNTVRDEVISDRVRYQNLPDEALIPTFFKEYYEYAGDARIPLPLPNPDAAGYAFVFPNLLMLGGVSGNLLFYRSRPNGADPNTCLFEVFAMQIPPAGEAEQAPARPQGPLELEDWPFILRQDVENIVRQQLGYRSKAFDSATMSPRYEAMIYSLHTEIDRYLAD